MSILNQLKNSSAVVETLLERFAKNEESENKLFSAISYSLIGGGKRLRPILSLETAKLFGGVDENVERIAVAIEMIHSYSLIHDDLPCLDNDDTRRGKPTNHKVFGEALALLAGDGLLNSAFEVLLSGKNVDGFFEATRYIAKCAGTRGMIGGQAVDISSDKKFDEETLLFLTTNKTAKLIMAAVVSIAIYKNANKEQFESLKSFALNFGIAFQIADDLLDKSENQSKKLLNFVSLFGEKVATEKLLEYTKLAEKSLEKFCEKADFLRGLCAYNSKRIE